jgi:hypothetical protein
MTRRRKQNVVIHFDFKVNGGWFDIDLKRDQEWRWKYLVIYLIDVKRLTEN